MCVCVQKSFELNDLGPKYSKVKVTGRNKSSASVRIESQKGTEKQT